jgi:hypothetical protein
MNPNVKSVFIILFLVIDRVEVEPIPLVRNCDDYISQTSMCRIITPKVWLRFRQLNYFLKYSASINVGSGVYIVNKHSVARCHYTLLYWLRQKRKERKNTATLFKAHPQQNNSKTKWNSAVKGPLVIYTIQTSESGKNNEGTSEN